MGFYVGYRVTHRGYHQLGVFILSYYDGKVDTDESEEGYLDYHLETLEIASIYRNSYFTLNEGSGQEID